MKLSPSKQAGNERKNSHFRLPFSRCYNVYEQEKRRTYDEQIWGLLFPFGFFQPPEVLVQLLCLFTGNLPPCWLENGR